MKPKNFILASGSVHRKSLLTTIGYEPAKIIPADIDETPKKAEKPTAYVKRMALEKAQNVAKQHCGEIVLASDTIIVVGTNIIQKSKNDEEQRQVMRLLSGKANKVLSSICVIDKEGHAKTKVVTSKVFLKNLSHQEIEEYVASREWVGCAGYMIEGRLMGLVKKINGSYSGVVGLPLCETKNMLDGVLAK